MNSFLADLALNSLKAEFPAETEHLAHLAAVLDDLRKSSKHVRSFVIELIQHHESYGKALAKSARSSLQVLAKVAGSLHLLHALRHLATHYETVGTLYSQQCSDLALWTNTDPADDVTALRKKLVEDLQAAIKETSAAKTNCVKAKSKYERMCREATSSQEGLEKLKTTPGSLYQVSALQRSEDKAKTAVELKQTAELALKDCLDVVKAKQTALTTVMKASSEAVQQCERRFLEHVIQWLGAFLQINEGAVRSRAELTDGDQPERLSAIALDLIEAVERPRGKASLNLSDILTAKVEGRVAAMEERKAGFRALKALLGELIIAEETAGRGLNKVSITYASLPVYLSNKQSLKEAWHSTVKAIEMLGSLHLNRCKTLSQHCLGGVSVTLTTLSQVQKDASSQCSKAVKDHLLLEDECLKGFDRLKRNTDDVALQQASQNLSEKMQRSAESTEKLVLSVLAEAANQEGRVLQGAKKVLVTLSSLETEGGWEVLKKAVTAISETQVWNDVEEQHIPVQGDVMALEQIKEEVSLKFAPKSVESEEADALGTPRTSEKEGSPLAKFSLPPESLMVESFSCALVRKIMLQGRLYLTTTHVCFHSYFNASTIFGKDTTFVVPISEILRVEKRTYAFLFDNAIAMVTKDFELLFASFLARDQALSTLTGLMQLHPEAAHSPDDLSLDLPPQAKLGLTKKLRGGRAGRATVEQVMEKLPPQSFFKYHVITRLAFSSPLLDVFQALFESGETWAKYYSSRRDTEVVMTQWSPSLSSTIDGSATERPASSRRDHQFTHPVKVRAPLIPATCTCREAYEVFFLSDTQLLIEVDIHVDSVPFADYFSTRSRWVLEHSEGLTYIDLYYGMQFHKETWFQSRIEKSGIDEFTESINTNWLPLARQIMQTRSNTGQQSTERYSEPQVVREVRVETQLHWVVWACLALVLCLTVQLWRLQARVSELESRSSL